MKQRDARAKDYYKVLHQEYQANTDLRKKVNQIEDEQKRLRDTEISLQNFAQAYELVKTERNITHSQLQNGLRVAMELREQFKLQESEIEMLKLLAESKQKLLGRSQLALFSKTQDKDAQYQELTKVQLQQQEAVQELELQQKSLIKTTNQINFIEQTLNRMQRYFEQAVQSRNDIGLKLIERNEEVCMFHEKLNVQDSVAHKGTEKLKEREDEMNFLNIKIKKLQREIDACRKILPEKETIEDEIVSHQNMLMSTKERLKYLEEKVINANNPERVRFLNGHNPTCAELRTKIEKLQVAQYNTFQISCTTH
jgi:chromosome segregation ATPase